MESRQQQAFLYFFCDVVVADFMIKASSDVCRLTQQQQQQQHHHYNERKLNK